MSLSWGELLLLGIIAILVFGDDMPQVAKKSAIFLREVKQYFSGFLD